MEESGAAEDFECKFGNCIEYGGEEKVVDSGEQILEADPGSTSGEIEHLYLKKG